jgi:ABC-type branched-subunit amino acid transport system ATPase component
LKWRVRWRRARGFCCSTSRPPASIQPSWKRIRETYALSVLLIGHTMRLVMGLSDRIIVLDHGVQLAEGSPREIQSDARVIAAYLGAEDAA